MTGAAAGGGFGFSMTGSGGGGGGQRGESGRKPVPWDLVSAPV